MLTKAANYEGAIDVGRENEFFRRMRTGDLRISMYRRGGEDCAANQ